VLCWTHAPKHTLHTPVLMHYTEQLTAEQDVVVHEQPASTTSIN